MRCLEDAMYITVSSLNGNSVSDYGVSYLLRAWKSLLLALSYRWFLPVCMALTWLSAPWTYCSPLIKRLETHLHWWPSPNDLILCERAILCAWRSCVSMKDACCCVCRARDWAVVVSGDEECMLCHASRAQDTAAVFGDEERAHAQENMCGLGCFRNSRSCSKSYSVGQSHRVDSQKKRASRNSRI